MPLCDDECLTDAMIDMQLAAQQPSWEQSRYTPPDSASSDDEEDEHTYVPTHTRSKTLTTGTATLGLGFSLTPVDTPTVDVTQATTPQPSAVSGDYSELHHT